MSLKSTSRRAGFGLAGALAAAMLMAASPAHAIKVVKDPATGQLRAPTADEVRAEQATQGLKNAKTAAQPRGLLTGKVNPAPIVKADGTIFQEMDESTVVYSTVTRNADGTLDFDCVQGKETADAIVNGKKKAAPHTHSAKEKSYEK